MTRLGSVLVFKKGVSKAEAEAALATLRSVLDLDYHVAKRPPVREFDDLYGGPVWYIP